jgi:protein CpxP
LEAPIKAFPINLRSNKMKKFGKIGSVAVLSLSAILGLGSFALLGQTSPGNGENGRQAVKHGHRAGNGKSGRHGEGKMMFGKLNLSEDQKNQLKQLRQASREASKPVMEQLRAKRQELRQSENGGTFDEALATQKLTEMAALQAKMMGERSKLRQAMMAILTPEQKTQLEQSRAEFKAKRGERRSNRGSGGKNQDN